MPAIVVVWAVLLGTAYVVRYQLGARLGVSLAAVAVAYGALAAAALTVIGIGSRGAVAVTGMLIPAAVAAALVLVRR